MDSSSFSSIEYLANEIKKELFSNQDFNTFVTQTSAYDTAWLAMIPYNNQEANGPMFESCLNWILSNQNEQGFWGESNGENLPTIYSLPTTLACMVALKKWNVGESHIRKGLKFIHANVGTLLKENSQRFPPWFTIESDQKLNDVRVGKDQPLLAYLERLSYSDNYIANEEDEVLIQLCEEDHGSLFQSPSATAQAFMATGNKKCLQYLMSIVQKCPNGVPSRFPGDEELKLLCMIDNIQRMGLSQHFEKEIEQILDQVYRNYQMNLQNNEYLLSSQTSDLPERLFKDSLAFRLLRLQGYKINQGAASSSSFLPYESFLRLVVAKCSIVITVADDFYDEEASLSELQILTKAIQSWDAKNLDGPSKVIFEALDDLVCDVAKMYHIQHKIDITPQLRHMWKETFHSWLMESLWSRTSNLPTRDKYLEVGMISIGAHVAVLHAASLGCPSLSSEMLGPINGAYENITKLLMATTRLLNDIQSYQKEREVGKMNYTLLHLNENPGGHIEDSIDFVKEILVDKKKEFLENVLMDGFNDMPRTMKLLHLSCLNVFHMFFNSCNLFDTKEAILEDIMRAIYIPLDQNEQTPMPPPPKPLPPMLPPQEKKIKKNIEIPKVNACLNEKNFKHQVGSMGFGINFVGRQAPKNYNSFGWSTKGFASQKLRSCFL
ncbi:hypothetical protein RND71_039080 [Anisodus tanguticus]|uniref:Uncharacterized protein n=1 Tax=Anisodus tanguticus TaxID=243964 RepID=A0AAE1QWN1_9SOLA|nr:hypothetical protein RND71_039080 [Anisodus tanguticus]